MYFLVVSIYHHVHIHVSVCVYMYVCVYGRTYFVMGGIVGRDFSDVTIQIDGTLMFSDDIDAWPKNENGDVFEWYVCCYCIYCSLHLPALVSFLVSFFCMLALTASHRTTPHISYMYCLCLINYKLLYCTV
jgi:hypothetical protein